MKKNIKKFASLMLALVMAIGLAAPAFAAPAEEPAAADITVTLQLVDADGNNIYPAGSGAASVTLPAGSSVYDLVTMKFPAVKEGTTTAVNGSAWNTYGDSDYLQTIWCNSTKYATVGLPDAPDDVDVEAWHNGYGRVDYNKATGVYTYIYAGYAWMYNVTRGGVSDSTVNTTTMNQYVLQQGDAVVLNYKVQISEEWTSTDVLPGLGVTNA